MVCERNDKIYLLQMIGIVLTFFQRHEQLYKTLESFKRYNPDDFFVVIVDDNSPDDIDITESSLDISILKLKTKNWICPAPVFNLGFAEALKRKPEAIIIQNAECYHNGDIVGYVKKHLTDANYLSFACYSLGLGQDVDFKDFNNRTAVSNGDSAWYNHSVYRPEALHFCCAIKSKNLVKLNGFDERFANGLGYEDNYFIHQVRTLGLKVKIVDDPFVFHQYHYGTKAFTFDADLYNRTGALCRQLIAKKEYRAKHLITPDL